MVSGLERWTAANLGLAWNCVLEPEGSSGLYVARRGGELVAVVRIAETMATPERRQDLAILAGEYTVKSAIYVVVTKSGGGQHVARYADMLGRAEVKSLTLPVPQGREDPARLWHCETCRGRHPLDKLAVCDGSASPSNPARN